MKLKATLCSVVLLGAWVVPPSFAEVQNVRVGGDVTVRAFHRKCMDLNCGDDTAAAGASVAADSVREEQDDFLLSTVGVNIGADLTENVSAFLRLVNERDWNLDSAGAVTSDIAVSQSYITLKELFYSPLTLRIGRQPIVWGRGFVLGSSLVPSVGGRGNDLHASISANEFTDFTAFDAIRATLDLSNLGGMAVPLTLDTVYIKLNENTTGLPDDVNVMGFNLGTHLDELSSEFEAYYLNKRDKNTNSTALAVVSDNDGSVNTMGIRGSAQPISGSSVFGEIAYQFGDRASDIDGAAASGSLPTAGLIGGDSQQAWAFNLGLEYTFADVAMTPKLGWEWIYWSGKDVDGAVMGWDPIARGYFTTALREFQTGNNTGFYNTAQFGDTGAFTNQHQLAWYGSLKPLEDLTIAPRLTFFFLDKGALPIGPDGTKSNKRKNYAGAEWDTQVLYNYTDDVQFGVIYAMFAPGNVYRSPNDSLAQEIVTTVGVKF